LSIIHFTIKFIRLGATYTMLRFAPSPTGDMPIGNLRVAILNYLVSQQSNLPFTVRIEDSDKAHIIEGKDTEIMQILEKFALIHDTVFHQSEHLHMHQTLAIKLLEEKKAFICTCTAQHCKCMNIQHDASLLKKEKIPFSIRIQRPSSDIVVPDILSEAYITKAETIEPFVILRADGTPTDTFACACGDMLSGVTLIIREKTSLLESAKQEHIKSLLNFESTSKYAHIASILDKQNKPMAQEDEKTYVKWLFAQGFIPDAIINYLLTLGYKEIPEEIFTLPQAIKWFKLENISLEDSMFELEKLKSINKAHLNNMPDVQLSSLFGFADADVGKLAKLYLSEASTINELALRIRPIFAKKSLDNAYKEEMIILQNIIMNAPMISQYDEFISYLKKNSNIEEKILLNALRLLLTGTKTGPDLCHIYPFIKAYLLEVAS